MALSSALIKKFASLTNDSEQTSAPTTAYGTVSISDGKTYVMLDGASSLTAISGVTDARSGDRVLVSIENHVAIILGNATTPASGYTATETEETLTEAIEEVSDSTVKEVVYYYATSESSSAAPDANTASLWHTDPPDVEDGEYLWQMPCYILGDGTVQSGTPVCISGLDGADGEDAVVMRIDSSRGTVFKNAAVSTVLSVVIYYGSLRITDSAALASAFGVSAYLEWSWQKMDEDTFGVISASDSRLSDGGFSFTLSPDDVDTKAVFQCTLNI